MRRKRNYEGTTIVFAMGNVVVVLEVGWNLKVSAGGDYETLENVLKVGKLKRV